MMQLQQAAALRESAESCPGLGQRKALERQVLDHAGSDRTHRAVKHGIRTNHVDEPVGVEARVGLVVGETEEADLSVLVHVRLADLDELMLSFQPFEEELL